MEQFVAARAGLTQGPEPCKPRLAKFVLLQMQHKHALYAGAPSPPEHASRNSLPESRPPPTNLMRVRTLLTRRALAGAPPVRRRMAHASARRRPQPLNAPLPHASCMALPTSRGPHPDRCMTPHLSRAGLADTIQQKQACCQFFACPSPACRPRRPVLRFPGGEAGGRNGAQACRDAP